MYDEAIQTLQAFFIKPQMKSLHIISLSLDNNSQPKYFTKFVEYLQALKTLTGTVEQGESGSTCLPDIFRIIKSLLSKKWCLVSPQY